MLRHLFAVIVLLLAMSPFTAPFQTCDTRQAIAIAVANHDDDPGSLVAPLVPKAFHMLVAPPALSSETPHGFRAMLMPSRAVANRVQHPPLRPTNLRI